MRAHLQSLRAFALFLLLGTSGSAQTITEFPLPTAGSFPTGIAAGPDGNLWFAEYNDRIGRITTAGVITEFPLPTTGNGTVAIAAGPDGNLWFTEYDAHRIGRITTAGVVTVFPIDHFASPAGIAAGPDGNLWFTEDDGNRIGRITTGGVMTGFSTPTAPIRPVGITAGPDGNLWFTVFGGNRIGRITTAGIITEFSIPTAGSGPIDITAGPDGNLWFTEREANKIGRITPTGVITEFSVPTTASLPSGIASGPDGSLWFTETAANKIGRVTTTGVITEFPIPTPDSLPDGIAAGPDGNIWFTERRGNKIGRLSAVRAPTLETRFLPVVGSTAGVGGSFFRTSMQLHNSTVSPMTGQIVFHPSGSSGSATDPLLAYALAPGQTQSIADLLPAMARSGLGSADIEVTSGGVPTATVRVFNDAGAAGTTGFTEELMRSEDALRPGSSGVLLLPADLARFRFNLGVRTLEAGAAATLTVRNASGAVVATVSRTFAATYHEQQSAAALLGVSSLPAGGSLTIAVTSGSAIFYGATVDNTTGDPSLQVARPAP
jgi:streptogramin lyase